MSTQFLRCRETLHGTMKYEICKETHIAQMERLIPKPIIQTGEPDVAHDNPYTH